MYFMKCRPFLPNIPHIVGDDDELNETDDRTQMANGYLHKNNKSINCFDKIKKIVCIFCQNL